MLGTTPQCPGRCGEQHRGLPAADLRPGRADSPRSYPTMLKQRWLWALPLVLGCGTYAPAEASAIRDRAAMFDQATVLRAEAVLNRTERETRIPVAIETVDSLNGANIDQVALAHAKRWGEPGLFVLVARREAKIEVRDFRSFLG